MKAREENSGADIFALGEAQACALGADAAEQNCDPSSCEFWFYEDHWACRD